MSSPRQSFSPARRWKIGFDVVLRTALVLAVAVMVNYFGAKFSHRYYLSQQTRVELSSRTLAVLHSLTNQVEVTLYYDTRDRENFYSDIAELLNAYRAANKNISIRTVDYLRDAGEATKVKEKYNLPGSVDSPNAPPSKDLIIFAVGERNIVVPGEAIVQTKLEQVAPANPNQKQMEFRRKPVAFNGEILFTAKLLALQNSQPLKAYFLQGHGESSLSDQSNYGYSKFGLALAQNYILPVNLELTGEHVVPEDCSLLIIAAPTAELDAAELQKIDKYLTDGGRLLALFNYASVQHPTGLEPILQRWGVTVVPDFVKDEDNKTDDLVVRKFSGHPVVSQLAQLKLQMIRPRCVARLDMSKLANAPQVEELAFSSDNSILVSAAAAPPRSFPLMVAVDQKPVAGVSNPRGTTRIVVVGDSLFLGNYLIEAGGNHDFVSYAANWLCNREQLLSGIAPRPVNEFRLLLTQKQNQQLRWLLLAALPGGVLVFGWLVWLVRRK
jgi:ABC-2 type transport system permease protein